MAAAIEGYDFDGLEPVHGVWHSVEAKDLFSLFLDRGVAAYECLAPQGAKPRLSAQAMMRSTGEHAKVA